VENKNAGAALFAFATGPADLSLRTRAMLACAALRDVALLPKYQQLLFARQDGGGEAMASDAVAVAASFAVARLGDKAAVPLLRKVATAGTPDMRAYAVLGLGAQKDKGSTALVAVTARSLDAGAVARAAAAYALGELGAEGETATLIALAEGTDVLPRQMALLALARMGAARGEAPGGKAALAAMADAVFSEEAEVGRARRASEALRQAAAAALVLLATRGGSRATQDPLPPPDESGDAESTLDQLVPRALTARDRAAALVAFAEPLRRAAQGALTTSTERARAVLSALSTREGSLEPFVGAEGGPELAPARQKAREIALALEPNVIALARHPDPTLRTKALVLLARSGSDAAASAVTFAITDPAESVQRVALGSIGQRADARSVETVAKVMRENESWPMRVLAAQALGRLGAAGAAASATHHLEEAATKEPFALVREAALLALASYDKPAAAQLAAVLAQTDPEPRVRDTAGRVRAGK
jgi:HEAT repeat protein